MSKPTQADQSLPRLTAAQCGHPSLERLEVTFNCQRGSNGDLECSPGEVEALIFLFGMGDLESVGKEEQAFEEELIYTIVHGRFGGGGGLTEREQTIVKLWTIVHGRFSGTVKWTSKRIAWG